MKRAYSWGAQHNIVFNNLLKNEPVYNFLTSVFTPTPSVNPRANHITIGEYVKEEFVASYFSICGEIEAMGNQGEGILRTVPAYPYGIRGSIDCKLLSDNYCVYKTGPNIGQQITSETLQLQMAQADHMREGQKAIMKLREWIVADSLFSGKLRMDSKRDSVDGKGPYAFGLPTQEQFDYRRDASLDIEPSDYGFDYWDLASDQIFEQLQLYRELLTPYGEAATDVIVDRQTYNILTRNQQVVEWMKSALYVPNLIKREDLNRIIGVPDTVDFRSGVQSVEILAANGPLRVWSYDGKITVKTRSGTVETKPYIPYGKALFFNSRCKGSQVRVQQNRQMPDYQQRNGLYEIQDIYFDAEIKKDAHHWEMYSKTVPLIGNINQTAVVQVLNPNP